MSIGDGQGVLAGGPARRPRKRDSRMLRWRVVAAGILVAALIGCATTETRPSASVTSLNVESSLGEAANRVQLLAQALDASGNVIGQRLEWMPEMIPALGRAYFEIRKMPPAAEYRVTVWAYDRIKGGGGA